jgi:predicted nucleotidyltransferase
MTIERNREEILRIAAEQELEELLQRKVDALTDASIHPAIRQRITAEARGL